MLHYEVELAVEPGTIAEWLEWIPAHVAEILALPGFLGAELLRLEEPGGESWPRFRVSYRVADEDALARYLAAHAPRLRAETARRFGERLRPARTVWRPIASYRPPVASDS